MPADKTKTCPRCDGDTHTDGDRCGWPPGFPRFLHVFYGRDSAFKTSSVTVASPNLLSGLMGHGATYPEALRNLANHWEAAEAELNEQPTRTT